MNCHFRVRSVSFDLCRVAVCFANLCSFAAAFLASDGASSVLSKISRRHNIGIKAPTASRMVSAATDSSTRYTAASSLEVGSAASGASFLHLLKQESAVDKQRTLDAERLHAQLSLEWAEQRRQAVAADAFHAALRLSAADDKRAARAAEQLHASLRQEAADERRAAEAAHRLHAGLAAEAADEKRKVPTRIGSECRTLQIT